MSKHEIHCFVSVCFFSACKHFLTQCISQKQHTIFPQIFRPMLSARYPSTTLSKSYRHTCTQPRLSFDKCRHPEGRVSDGPLNVGKHLGARRCPRILHGHPRHHRPCPGLPIIFALDFSIFLFVCSLDRRNPNFKEFGFDQMQDFANVLAAWKYTCDAGRMCFGFAV